MVSLTGGNSLDTNVVIIIVLLVIIVIIIIVIAVIASKPSGPKRPPMMSYDYLEGYTNMNPTQRVQSLKKTINEGYKAIATKSSKEKYNKIKVPNVEELLKKYSI